MKTPNEIKKGLKCCMPRWGANHWKSCSSKCPYITLSASCRGQLVYDALAYIQLLEKQRSALLADLRDADKLECAHCAHYIPAGAQCEGEGDCLECDRKNCVCNECRNNSNWKWRGVLEVEHVREF